MSLPPAGSPSTRRRRQRPPRRVDPRAPSIYRLRRRAGRGYAVTDFPRDGLIRLIDAPELPFRMHTRDVIKTDWSTVVVRAEMPIGGGLWTVAYKRVQRRGLWKVFTGLLGGNRTLRAWRMGRRLAARGVTTARPIAAVAPPWFLPARPSFLTTEWVAGENLAQFAAGLARLEPGQCRRQLHLAAAALGELLGRMHAAGVSHRDLKAGNLLLVPHGDGLRDGLRAVVIDLDGAVLWPWVPTWLRVRNLGRFAFACETAFPLSHAVRRRFLAAYLRAAGCPESAWKSLWARVGRRSAAVARRKMKSLKKSLKKSKNSPRSPHLSSDPWHCPSSPPTSSAP